MHARYKDRQKVSETIEIKEDETFLRLSRSDPEGLVHQDIRSYASSDEVLQAYANKS